MNLNVDIAALAQQCGFEVTIQTGMCAGEPTTILGTIDSLNAFAIEAIKCIIKEGSEPVANCKRCMGDGALYFGNDMERCPDCDGDGFTARPMPTSAPAETEKGDIAGWLRRRAGNDLVMIPGRLAGEIADHIDKLAMPTGSKVASLPRGWKLVPIEPTEDMVINGFESAPNEFFSKSEVWQEYSEMSGCQQAAHRAKLCWAAMIATAPAFQEVLASTSANDSYEHRYAIKEAARVEAARTYFDARKDSTVVVPARIFDAGFDRGYDAAKED